MTYDFYAGIWAEKKVILENEMRNKIRNGKGSVETKNARDNLPRFFSEHFSPNWYSKIKDISLFAKYYGGRKEKDLLKIGCDEYILRHLEEKGKVNRMDDNWILDKDNKSTIFGIISNPCLGLPIKYSFSLHVKFTLQKPYISKDDEGFYIHDNPVSKEKVFKVPYIRASSWKGNLLWAAKEANNLSEDDEKITRIFGNKKGEESQEKLKKGRLYTYPTFFNRISLDIINPHDRETKTGKNPITLEVVPPETDGDLYLLYVPFEMIGENEDRVKEEIKEDLLIICKAVRALLTEYGMSAKRTSGYGSALIGGIEFKSELLKEYDEYTDLNRLIEKLDERIKDTRKSANRGDAR